MPPINKYRCNFCDFSFPDGWGGYFYVEVDEEFIRNRIRELEDQLSALHRNLANIKSYVMETERVLSEFAENIRTHFEESVLPYAHETIQKIQSTINEIVSRKSSSAYFIDMFEELKEDIERMWNSWLQIVERVKGYASSRVLLEKLEGLLREQEDMLKQQIRDLKGVEFRLKSEGLRSIRLKCPHPREHDYATEILGQEPSSDLFKSRTGFNSYVVCIDCLHQFEADLRDEKVNEWRFWYGRPSFKEAFRGKPSMKDERKCLKCGSRNVKTAFEMIGAKCPKCKKGTIEEIETGTMT
jgi:hypothetical protein